MAQSLGFDFAVWHSHRALWGIWLDVQVYFSYGDSALQPGTD